MALKTEHIDIDFNLKLQKDLQENEIICPSCGGSGLQVDDNPFGLKSDKGYKSMFPHKKQTIIGCQRCYNGVQKVCKHCNRPLGRNWQCNCEGYKDEQNNKHLVKDLEQWDKANKITVDELIKSDYSNMLYLYNHDQFFSDINNILEFIYDEYLEEKFKQMPIMVYKTYTLSASLDAESIIENATDDLHEDACERALYYADELQKMLDEFADKIKDETMTYCPDYKEGVIITIDDILK